MHKVIYSSRGGNTQKLAEAIARGAGASAEPVGEYTGSEEKIDNLFVGASIYAGKIDASMRQFLQGLRPEQIGQVVVFGTSAGKKTALPEIEALLREKGVAVLGKEFHCKGSFLFVNSGRPNDADLKEAEAFAKSITQKVGK